MPGFLIFPLLAIDTGIVNIAVYSLASNVYTKSEKILLSLGNKIDQRKKGKGRLINRQILSCSALRVEFVSNFFDRDTALVIQNFCIDEIVSVSLIGAKGVIE
ncbi:hypothetical protein Fcan01_00812 [Folsomia candida]|uniref:Uncharacterized protein n=1 Tax=Folsomia candida TaxID=158441 RepID=A0A226EW65_FOLCA|nr:hypothetical protein Fcan01_00812 [Folsomia candida]